MWSDQMIVTTVMRYGHEPTGMKGITFNENALERWARSMHTSSVMEKDLLDMKESTRSKDVTTQFRVNSDTVDWQKISYLLGVTKQFPRNEKHGVCKEINNSRGCRR